MGNRNCRDWNDESTCRRPVFPGGKTRERCPGHANGAAGCIFTVLGSFSWLRDPSCIYVKSCWLFTPSKWGGFQAFAVECISPCMSEGHKWFELNLSHRALIDLQSLCIEAPCRT